VGVRPGLQRDQQGRVHLVHRSIRPQRDIRRDIVASREDPLSLHPDDRHLSSRAPYRGPQHQQQCRPQQQQFRPVQQNRPRFQAGGPSSSTSGTRTTGPKKGCWTCGEPHYQRDCPVERTRASGSAGPTTVGDMGKAHRIHAGGE
jgi:hypothetical protein